jgi:lipopolysaccharide/colanic/teichoic acid biosynthesis glycosyltransferase
MKRLFDGVLSAVALVLLSPLFLVIAAAIVLTSSGPAVFRQTRIGKDFAPFTLLKFRTMRESLADHEVDFAGGRITGVGGFLRRTKLDELPQLWNIFVGHMSFVGPRPELPQYVERYRADYVELLEARPGLTDPASLAFHNEPALLRAAADPERTYVEHILPQKIALSRDYLHKRSFISDLRMLSKTLAVSLRSPR